MDWYVFGDLTFLADILNALAAIFAPFRGGAANEYSGLISIAAMIGVLGAIAAYAAGSGPVPIRKILLAIVVYGVVFVPATTVTVQNVYTSATRTIANVPLSIAVVGSLFSKIGYGLTELFEQAFSYPGITQDGFVDALDTWRAIRALGSDVSSYAVVDQVDGGAFSESWRNYVSTCVAFAIDAGYLTMPAVRSAPTVQGGLFVDNNAIGARINVGSGWEDEFCRTAHGRLLAYSRTSFMPAFETQVLAPRLTVPGRTTGSALSRVDSMVDIFDLGAVGRREAVLSLLLSEIFDHGVVRRLALDGKTAEALMIGDAIRQRNAQWSAQSAVFEQYAVPVLTFIEALFYGLSPLVLVFLVVAVSGAGTVFRFLQVGLWIQFWFPIAALVHLFTYHTVLGDLGQIEASNLLLTSLGGQYQADSAIQKWLAVAGFFASAIPVLALFLLTGSIFSLQSIASSIGGPDTITEGIAAPTTYSPAPMYQGLPSFNVDPLRGSLAPSADNVLPSYSVTSDRSSNVSSAIREMQGAREAFSTALSRLYGESMSVDTRGNVEGQSTMSALSQHGEAMRFLQSNDFGLSQRIAQQYGISESQAVDSVTQFALNGGLSGTKAGVSAGARAAQEFLSKSSEGISEGRSNDIAQTIARTFAENADLSSSLLRSIASDMRRGVTDSAGSGVSFSTSEEARQSAERYLGAERSYERSVSEAQSFGSRQQLDTPYLASQIYNDRPSFENLMRLMAQKGLHGETSRTANDWIDRHLFPDGSAGRQTAMAGAALAVLERHGELDALAGALSPYGIYVPDIGNAGAHEGVAGGLGPSGRAAAGGSGGGGAGGLDVRRADVASRHEALMANADEPFDVTPAQAYAAGTAENRAQHVEALRPAVAAGAAQRAQDIFEDGTTAADRVNVVAREAQGALPGAREAMEAQFREEARAAGLTELQADFFAAYASSPLGTPPIVEMGRMEAESGLQPEVQREVTTLLEKAAQSGGEKRLLYLDNVGRLNETAADDGSVVSEAMRRTD